MFSLSWTENALEVTSTYPLWGAEQQVQRYILRNFVKPSAEESDDRKSKTSPE
jgi:hypothetical protein